MKESLKVAALRIANEMYQNYCEKMAYLYPTMQPITFSEWLDTEITDSRYTIGNKKADRAMFYIARNHYNDLLKELAEAIESL